MEKYSFEFWKRKYRDLDRKAKAIARARPRPDFRKANLLYRFLDLPLGKEDALLSAQFLIHDLKRDRVRIFTDFPLLRRQRLALTAQEGSDTMETPFFIPSVVSWCHKMTNENRVIKAHPLLFRAELHFDALSREDFVRIHEHFFEVLGVQIET